MSLPTLDKTWQFDVNQDLISVGPTALPDHRRNLLAIKDSLKAFGSSPWTVIGSSNSVASGMDAVDRWSVATDLVWNTAAHSWIVLQQAGINPKYQICIDLNAVDVRGSTISFIWSPVNGFGLSNGGTNGSTTARPTATDEAVVYSGSNWFGGSPSDLPFSTRVHVMQSTDGQCTRIVGFTSIASGSGIGPQLFWQFERPKNPASGWTNPAVLEASNAAAAGPATIRYIDLNDTATRQFAAINGSSVGVFYSTDFYNGSAVGQGQVVANDISGEFPLTAIGLWCEVPGRRGRQGMLFDIWYGSTVAADGDTYPNDATRQFAQFGDVVFPWNGTTPIVY